MSLSLLTVALASGSAFDIGSGTTGGKTYTGPTGSGGGVKYEQWKWDANYSTGTRYIIEVGTESSTRSISGSRGASYYYVDNRGGKFYVANSTYNVETPSRIQFQ